MNNELALRIISAQIDNNSTIQNCVLMSDLLVKVINKYEIKDKNLYDDIAKKLREAQSIVERLTWSDPDDSYKI